MGWMFLTGLCFIAVTALVKLVGQEVPAVQAAFLRYLMGLVFVLPMLGALGTLRGDRGLWALFGARGLAHGAGVVIWFHAMTVLPVAEVTALGYLSPVFVTLGAALFLGERLAARRLLAVLAAFCGALVILRPGFREISGGHLAMLGAALALGVSYLMAKEASGRAPAAAVVAMLSLVVTAVLAPFALAAWEPVATGQLAVLFAVAFFATAGHYTMTLALAAAPIAVTQPVGFLQLIWAVLLGAVAFAEPIDGWVLLGGAIILGAVCFIAWRESVLRARAGRKDSRAGQRA